MLSVASVERRLDHMAEGVRPFILLVLLSLSLFLPGIASLPPVDRDESRYIQATRQMLETGDLVQIRFQNEARNKKPAGIYWLQAGMVSILSSAESASVWPYRLVSVIGATGAVLLTFVFGAAMFDRRTALLGAALLAATADLIFEAHVATTDAVLLATAVAAQGVLALAYLGTRRGETVPLPLALSFWLAQGLAILVKGPLVPGLSILTMAALVIADRKARWLLALKPAWGIPVVGLLVVPWLILIEQQTQGAFLKDAVGHDLLGKIVGSQEAHGAPPGTDVALQGLSLPRLHLAVLDLTPIVQATEGQVELVIGQDVLRRLAVDLDFPQARLALRPSGERPPGVDLRAAPARLHGRELTTEVAVEGRTVSAVVDTGSSAALALSEREARAAGLLAPGRPSRMETGGDLRRRGRAAGGAGALALGGRRAAAA